MSYAQYRLTIEGRRATPYSGWPRIGSLLAIVVSTWICTGCGEPGSPQPPSLNLPVPVRNLAAQRTADAVHLTWSTTNRTTDHTRPAGTITTRICRKEGSGPCERVADERLSLGSASSYDDVLPVTMTVNAPALLTYYVELMNHAQNSAGLSNPAFAADGPDLPAITALTATVRAEGVLLHWDTAAANGCDYCPLLSPMQTKVRIERVLQSSANAKPVAAKATSGRPASLLTTTPPSPRQTLEVAAASGPVGNEALDRTAEFGQTYTYQARQIESLSLEGHTFELLGRQSEPATVETHDTFPPAIPSQLAAVADPSSMAIDLSWSSDSERDLAGYIVYRRTATENGPALRISGAAPLPTPTFHDAQIQPGVRYAYSVSAIDQSGNESGQSVAAQETLAPLQ